MANRTVKLPPGFVLEGQQPQAGINLPPGFQLEQPAQPAPQPYQPAEQGATGFEYYPAPPIGQMAVGAMKSLPTTGGMTGVETGYERPGQPVMDVDQAIRQATTPQNTGEYAGQIIGNVAQQIPAISAGFELASNLPRLVRSVGRGVLGKVFPVAKMTGTTPARIAELKEFPSQVEGIRQTIVSAERNVHKAASAQFPKFEQPIKTGRMIEQPAQGPLLVDEWGEVAPRGKAPETTTWQALQEQRSNLLKDIANEKQAVARGAAPRFDLADMYEKLHTLDGVMSKAALEQGGPQGLAQLQVARQAFGKYMQDFHDTGSPLRAILDAKPGEATKAVQHFLKQDTGPRALETLRSYGVNTAPIEQMIAKGGRPLKVTAAESAKLRSAANEQQYIARRLNEALSQATTNELPGTAEARLPAQALRSRWPSVVGEVPGVNIFSPRRLTQYRLKSALEEAATAGRPAALFPQHVISGGVALSPRRRRKQDDEDFFAHPEKWAEQLPEKY